MKLIIRLKCIREDKATAVVTALIKMLKKKFVRKLKKKEKAKENKGLSWEVKEIKNGYLFYIMGPDHLVEREYKETSEEWEKIKDKKAFGPGLFTLTTIGVNFDYWKENDKGEQIKD